MKCHNVGMSVMRPIRLKHPITGLTNRICANKLFGRFGSKLPHFWQLLLFCFICSVRDCKSVCRVPLHFEALPSNHTAADRWLLLVRYKSFISRNLQGCSGSYIPISQTAYSEEFLSFFCFRTSFLHSSCCDLLLWSIWESITFIVQGNGDNKGTQEQQI